MVASTRMLGSTLSHYVVEALLGEGGMGVVYRARDTVLNRTVAIKVLTTTATDDAESKRRLLNEARAASALNHSNIVTIYAIGQEREVDFIVMEHVSGAPLTVPVGGLPLDHAIDYACQMAGALAAAHEAGIIHRDIKPANLMIGSSGQVKVLDFGIARRTLLASNAETQSLTANATISVPGTIVGTVGYVSPEQVAGQPADTRSDVFSLGSVMFEMLTGTRAFPGDSAWAIVNQTLYHDPPPLEACRPEVPARLAKIVSRCLAKDPANRYLSARELYEDLLALRAERIAAASPARSRHARWAVAMGVLLALLGGGTLGLSHWRETRLQSARAAVPAISRLAAEGDIVGAYRLAQSTLKSAPEDSQVREAWNSVTRPLPVTSDPPGADVAFRAYSGLDEGWIPLGKTPVTQRRPLGLMRWRVTKDGYDPIEVAPNEGVPNFTLVPRGSSVPGMVYVPAGSYELESEGTTVDLPEYWLDKYEVTNREFKQFIDAGGYRNPQFWLQPFVKDGHTLSLEQALADFRDTTGRPGPSTWELGGYPDGQDDWPVSGVSWYEAAAYATYAGKRLPTVYHWFNASGASGVFSEILRFSNFGKGTTRVASTGGLGPYGTYDMAGNVKEWCWNEVNHGRHYILGGAWNEAKYQFHDEDAQPPFERRAGFGFRCMLQHRALDANLLKPILTLERDPSTLKPVGDEVYQVYRHLYDYDSVPLDSQVEEIDDGNPHWRRERVSFRAAYGTERVPAYLFLPRGAPAPYQTVVYFPGSDAVILPSSRDMSLQFLEFIIRSGRAVIYPIYQQMYERRTNRPHGQNYLREISIQRGQDVRRTIDYLDTRPDIDHFRIAFYGLSLGAQLGPVYLAIEPRLRTGVLLSGGFETWQMPPEADPVNFTPRVKQPVLMVNGREDFDLPYTTAQVPMFRMLGTPPADKRHAVLEGGHLPPRPQDVYKEILDWLDRYLGRVGE